MIGIGSVKPDPLFHISLHADVVGWKWNLWQECAVKLCNFSELSSIKLLWMIICTLLRSIFSMGPERGGDRAVFPLAASQRQYPGGVPWCTLGVVVVSKSEPEPKSKLQREWQWASRTTACTSSARDQHCSPVFSKACMCERAVSQGWWARTLLIWSRCRSRAGAASRPWSHSGSPPTRRNWAECRDTRYLQWCRAAAWNKNNNKRYFILGLKICRKSKFMSVVLQVLWM